MMLYTTFALCRKHDACIPSYRKLAKHLGGIAKYGKDTPIPLDLIVNMLGVDDGIWALRATTEPCDRFARLFACECAERVLPVLEEKYPNDNHPRAAIETAQRYANGEATQDELIAARSAAGEAAGDSAWFAAWFAARSAAGEAAGDSARCAAWSAAWSAAGEAAGDSAWFAAWFAEGEWQRATFLQRLEEGYP